MSAEGLVEPALEHPSGRLVPDVRGPTFQVPEWVRMPAFLELAYGFERPVLLGETLTDAIGFGPRAPGDAEVRAGATAARADAFIRTMPEGYDTRLTGAPLSGGENQRIGLARAFVQSAPHGRLLVLDDVAASLDTVTEHRIGQALTGTGPLAGRAGLVVTHRASTADGAQVVVWLDAGRVRRVGTHRELWMEEGYRAVFRPASGGDGEDGSGPARRRQVRPAPAPAPAPESDGGLW
ncbi:hypothetical protein OG252_43340 [Streptomyces sp. NBC_01352]|uniref:RamC N-terminal domain-containing protein n=1 Tax=Streptomyces plumbiresistens TaxID=511811 RepID=A0ABP7T297_9ACTN|nr:hypothetical protein [Streptomyces sp. NBC_01352]